MDEMRMKRAEAAWKEKRPIGALVKRERSFASLLDSIRNSSSRRARRGGIA